MSSDKEIIRVKVPAKHAHTFSMFLLKEQRSAMSKTIEEVIQELAYWQLKKMLVEETIAKNPERENALITETKTVSQWLNQITAKISSLTEEYAILIGVKK